MSFETINHRHLSITVTLVPATARERRVDGLSEGGVKGNRRVDVVVTNENHSRLEEALDGSKRTVV